MVNLLSLWNWQTNFSRLAAAIFSSRQQPVFLSFLPPPSIINCSHWPQSCGILLLNVVTRFSLGGVLDSNFQVSAAADCWSWPLGNPPPMLAVLSPLSSCAARKYINFHLGFSALRGASWLDCWLTSPCAVRHCGPIPQDKQQKVCQYQENLIDTMLCPNTKSFNLLSLHESWAKMLKVATNYFTICCSVCRGLIDTLQ